MSREALQVGAFTWGRIQRLHDPDSAIHWQRCEAEGLSSPQEVFSQLFHKDTHNADFEVIVRAVDWGRVRWELEELSGRIGISNRQCEPSLPITDSHNQPYVEPKLRGRVVCLGYSGRQ